MRLAPPGALLRMDIVGRDGLALRHPARLLLQPNPDSPNIPASLAKGVHGSKPNA